MRAVKVDPTTVRFLDLLSETLADEPPAPDLDIHTGHHLNAVARHHDAWERNVEALRLLIGIRMTDLALDASKPQPEPINIQF